MKRLMVATLLIAMIPASLSAAPLFFTAKPNLGVQSASLGLQTGPLKPYLGLDVLGMGVKYSNPDYEAEGSAFLFIPRAGARFDFSGTDVHPYVFGEFFKSFASVDVTVQSVDVLEGETKDAVEKLLGFWGFNAGFGAEYMFSEHFGIGGEYALRYLHISTDFDEAAADGGGGGGEFTESWKHEVSGTLKMTYAAIALNYYF